MGEPLAAPPEPLPLLLDPVVVGVAPDGAVAGRGQHVLVDLHHLAHAAGARHVSDRRAQAAEGEGDGLERGDVPVVTASRRAGPDGVPVAFPPSAAKLEGGGLTPWESSIGSINVDGMGI